MSHETSALAGAIAAIRPGTVLLLGERLDDLDVALRGRGIQSETWGRHEEAERWTDAERSRRSDTVVWRPPALTPDEARPAADRLVPAVAGLADRIAVLTDELSSLWAESFVRVGFYLDVDAAVRAPGILTFRRAAGGADTLDPRVRAQVEEIDRLYRQLDEQQRTIAALRRELAGLRMTLGWQVLERCRDLEHRVQRLPVLREGYRAVHRAVEVVVQEGLVEAARKTGHKVGLALRGRSFLVQPRERRAIDLNEQYQRWLVQQERLAGAPGAAPGTPARGAAGPIVSLAAAPARIDTGLLAAVLQNLRAQRYVRWELCVAIPAAVWTAEKVELEAAVAGEPRLRLAVTDSDGIDYAAAFRVASGDLLGVLDLHDTLHPDALLELVARLDAEPGLDAVYSDEDVLDADGRRVDPFFKPDWSPDLLLATDYVLRLGLVRRAVLEAVGGVRGELRAGSAWDLWLRVVEQARGLARVPKVLYHRRARVPTVDGLVELEQRRWKERVALEEALRRRGLGGEVQRLDAPFGAPAAFAPRPQLRGRPLVSIIVPTRDKVHFLEQTIRSVREWSNYDHYEIIVVDNDSRDTETLRYLDALAPPCRTLRWPGPFNFSAINNAGVQQAKGEHVLFLNNDVEVLRPDWLAALLEHSQRPDIGAVGAKLLYPDGRIQHGGVVVGVGGLAVHAFRLWPGEPDGAHRLADLVRDCSAVTAACMMVRRRVFEEVGGFDERLCVVFNDVDLCLRIREAGYRIVYTPLALLTHHEGVSRGRLHPTAEENLFRTRWARVLGEVDPYYNPNLTRTHDDWSLNLERPVWLRIPRWPRRQGGRSEEA